jgi:hypothetical protein
MSGPSYMGRLRALRDCVVLRAPENDKLRDIWMDGRADRKIALARPGETALYDYRLSDLGRGYADRVLRP